MNAKETADAIRALAAADEPSRARATAALYEAGRSAAEAATATWRKDAELAGLFTGHPTVGVAVQPEMFDKIRLANGSPELADVPPDQDAREFELEFGDNVSLDILTTRDPHGAGAIARFLARCGEAIQQVELPVKDVDRATAILRERFSLAPLYPETRRGANATRINFFLMQGPAAKVLIELVENG